MGFQPITITLDEPLMHGAEEVRELRFARKLVAGDLRGIPVNSMAHDHVLEITSRLTGVPTPVLKKMDMTDYMKVLEVVGNFLPNSPRTGEMD